MPDPELDEFTQKKPFLSDSVYNRLKQVLAVGFPAFTTLYLGLASLWEWENADKVGASIGLIATFLGVVLLLSSSRYTSTVDGQIVVTQDPETGKILHSLNFDGDPDEVRNLDLVRFKVDNQV